MAAVRSHSSAVASFWSDDPDFGRPVHVIEFDRPAGDDEAITAQSIGLMHWLSNRDSRSAAVRAAAIAATARLDATATAQDIADAIFRFCQHTVTYTHEADMRTPFSDLAHFVYDQTLIPPVALLAMPRPAGDCVDYSMLTAALCRLCGIPTAYRTIAADPASEAYSHVYVVAQLAPGRFYPLDASNGPEPGAEFALPQGKKTRTWPNPADLEKPMSRKDLLYRRRHARLGDAGDGGDYWDPYANAGVDPTYTGTQNNAPSGSSSGTSWTKIFTTIANDAAGIAAPLIRQANIKAPYYIAGANGAQILYDASTGKTLNAGAASQRTPALVSQNLIIGGAVAAALLLVFSQRK